MSWQIINNSEIETGQPVSSSTQSKIKNNLENLQDRITTLEGGGNTVYPPLTFRVNGNYTEDLTSFVNILKTTTNFNLTITGVRLLIDQAGSSGKTEIDLLVKTSSGYQSIFSTKPSVLASAGDDSISSNAVLNPALTNVLAGSLLRLDLVEGQTYGKNFLVRVDYIKT